ncbi:ABC transporter permease [Streptococcus oricebi]|uniref:ABC transporter permease n=1 Tax=Streptococcus oricebi TaxID=1547447 RepID=A0ABS5B740_9STRE|nr:ABC transporter permease [Streptococcus oricebi]MBP2623824.1 ABC transporter permease [Streptococcus oricebi]
MIKLIKIEFLKLFSGRKTPYLLYGLFALLVLLLVSFLRIFASESSFGNVFKSTSDTFSIFAVMVGVVLTLVSFNQEIQQKTIKTLLVTPIKRSEILFSKLLVSLSVSFSILIILACTSFLATSLLFGFFTEGAYSSSGENIQAFSAGLVQMLTAFFTTIFYSCLILCLFLITNSLSFTLIGILLAKGLGELISRSLLAHHNAFLYYSPLGMLNILNPLTSTQAISGYLLQLVLVLIYSTIIFILSCKLFDNKEF